MPDRADNDDVWGVLFEAEPPCLTARARNMIGNGLRGLYGHVLDEEPNERIAELIEALRGTEPASRVSNAG